MLASGASCGEAANLVDNHGGSYWVSWQRLIAMIREKWSLSDLRWSNKEDKDLFDRGEEAIEIYGLVGVKIKKVAAEAGDEPKERLLYRVRSSSWRRLSQMRVANW